MRWTDLPAFLNALTRFFLVCIAAVLAAAADTSALTLQGEFIELAPHVEILEDPENRLTLADVRTKTGFAPNAYDTVNIGRSASAFWFRFKLIPGTETAHTRFLEVGKQGIGELDLYVPEPTRAGRYKTYEFGVWRPVPPYGIPARTSVVMLPDQWDQEAWFYLRVKSDISINFPLTILSSRSYISRLLPDLYGFGIIFGILLAMALYNLAIYLFLRDRTYFYYVCYVFSMFWYVTVLYGHFELVFDPGPRGIRTAFFLSCAATWLFGGVFARLFLNTRLHAPVLDRFIIAAVCASLLVAAGALAGFNHTAHTINTYLGMTAPVLIILAGVRVWQSQFTPAKYFLAAWLVLALGTVLYSMGGILIPRSPVTVYTFAAGTAVEAILLSLALADRIRLLRIEKDLLKKNEQKLRQQALTDPLTGLFNRRYLLDTLDREIRVAQHNKSPLCMLLLDVDHFKGYNDTYGHPEGDRVLAALADVLAHHVRYRDVPCRYGGEEFIVVLPHTGLDHARQVAERVRTAFAQIIFRPDDGPGIQVSVSIGLAELGLRETGDQLLNRADKALYRAKQDGRNRVISDL